MVIILILGFPPLRMLPLLQVDSMGVDRFGKQKWAEIKGFQPTESYYDVFIVKFHCVEFGRPACGAL